MGLGKLRGAIVPLAVVLAGCSAASSQRVTSESIVKVPPGFNLITDPSFTRVGRAWVARTPVGHSVAVIGAGDGRMAVVSIPPPGARGVLVFAQSADVVPERGVGSRYLLQVRLRAAGVTRPVETEIKLQYVGGSYQFFTRAPSATTGRPRVLRGTTHGWMTAEVEATAARPLAGIQVFLLDSAGGRRFAGTIYLAHPSLRSR